MARFRASSEANAHDEGQEFRATSGPFKPLRTILEQEMKEAESELARPARGLILSGVMAGIGVGFSMLLMAALHTRFAEAPPWLLQILIANAYTVGFILVILARTDLFTEYTTIAVLPFFRGQASLGRVGRLWGLVYVGNIAGTALMAGLAVLVGPALEVAELRSFGEIARHLVRYTWWIMLLSGLFAGWLMGLLSWLVIAGRETTSQIVLIWLVTVTIGFVQLHHSITGSAEVLAGLFATTAVSIGDYMRFLAWTTLGNALGGLLFAVIIYHSTLLDEKSASRGPNNNVDRDTR